ncbi:bifunctional glycosyltransferase family 2 protein/class I SAM-dependent methyltransferase [Clostridium folliculivorans]|uniref:Glycosyltransferase 2-like domain-containing protein n=1 Tax=Clostridium folliculivorans TaxID=2886038 RepID=A0A9W6DBJ2_9CLOT|nr:bifunctional glycosyltransferase family 2 protein/class I SAM-dependent methyltransferase [Clostridium folliculivorans]GKU25982.1 hypothetical protein CFOLD11_28090 [Clostridium folliculivorans]GKU28068.1 hypothetical protein CFB3_01740 [Clostridium folliculivorans]
MNRNIETHKTSIIILTYNNIEYTKKCIDSIRKYTEHLDYEIIVIDNNSSDETKEWLKRCIDIRCIFNEYNIGFPKGCNQGINIATGDSILLLNNDVIVTPKWLNNLSLALWSNDSVGAVGAVTNSCSYYQTIPTSYNNYDELVEFADKYNDSDEKKWEQRIKLIGFCMLIKKSVINEVGLLDERFTPGNYEDDDYSYRIIKAGYKLLLCKDTFVHHYGSVSFKRDPGKTNNIMYENYRKFIEKWGFDPSSMTLIRFEILNKIINIDNKPMNILDIGCGCGATCLKIRDEYENTRLFGIEKNIEAAEIAKSFMNVKVGDVENIKFGYEESFFDYIIISELLQYLYYPERLLSIIKKYLKPLGHLILIVPNAMYFPKIKQLINGNWRYDDGCLGSEDVSFFTFNDLYKLLADCKYYNIKAEGILQETNKEDEEFIENLLSISKPDMKIQYLSSRYIVVADNNENGMDQRLAFILRRIEYDVDIENSVGKIAELFLSKKLSMEDIDRAIEKHIILKDKLRSIMKDIYLEEKR